MPFTLGLKNCRDALTLYETAWHLNPYWDSMTLTYRHGMKLTSQELLLGRSCPSSTRMTSTQLRTSPVQWLHLRTIQSQNKNSWLWQTLSRSRDATSLAWRLQPERITHHSPPGKPTEICNGGKPVGNKFFATFPSKLSITRAIEQARPRVTLLSLSYTILRL